MKKIIILLLLVGFTKSYAQVPVIPVAKKVVNKFIKFGMQAGVNLNTSGDIDEIISKVEGPQSQTQIQQTCTTQQVYENRLMGYNVVYEFAGKQYTVKWPKDPGPTIKLQITPVN